LKDIRIEFKMVHNANLKTDPGWAKKYGYYFSYDEEQIGSLKSPNVTWEKILE